ncbi:MAG TPA: type II toxin-antitoxin system VapC family toxin [Roseiarcus sp.]
MILVDTSVWVHHFRERDSMLTELLERGAALTHPFVIGELALGNLRHRELVLRMLSQLPAANVATNADVLRFIEQNSLFGRGVGYVDAHLLAANTLTAGSQLWTLDKRLNEVAVQLGMAAGTG